MKEAFNLLDDIEKKRLRLLGLLVFLIIVFFAFVSMGERRSYHSLTSGLQAREKAFAAVEKKRAASAEEWAGWEQAYRDIEDLKKTYFYQEKDSINVLLRDLQKVFFEAGINARSLKYAYRDLEKKTVKRVDVSFMFNGSYLILKKFLETVERFPKFLVLEKIDFMKISGEGSLLELKIMLAAYHEAF